MGRVAAAAAATTPPSFGCLTAPSACRACSARRFASCTNRFISGLDRPPVAAPTKADLLVNSVAAAISFFFSSTRTFDIPDGDCCASNSNVHNSLAKEAASSIPKKPARSSCARLGSTLGGCWVLLLSIPEGKNRFTAVLCTMSSSNPSTAVMRCSTQFDKTGILIFDKKTGVEKLDGNLVLFSIFVMAWSSETLAVPLMEGISCDIDSWWCRLRGAFSLSLSGWSPSLIGYCSVGVFCPCFLRCAPIGFPRRHLGARCYSLRREVRFKQHFQLPTCRVK